MLSGLADTDNIYFISTTSCHSLMSYSVFQFHPFVASVAAPLEGNKILKIIRVHTEVQYEYISQIIVSK